MRAKAKNEGYSKNQEATFRLQRRCKTSFHCNMNYLSTTDGFIIKSESEESVNECNHFLSPLAFHLNSINVWLLANTG